MLDFVLMALAYVVGGLVYTGIMLAVVLNKKVMRAYMKWATNITNELTNELINNLDKEEEEA